MSSYTADQIQVIQTTTESVRRRPGMYIGHTNDSRGAVEMVRLWLDLVLSVRASLTAADTLVDVVLLSARRARVGASGFGLPVGADRVAPHFVLQLEEDRGFEPLTKVRTSERIGLHGVGLVVARSLSGDLTLDNVVDGEHWRVRYVSGACVEPARVVGASEETGFTVEFDLDDAIFGPAARFDDGALLRTLETLAFGHPGSRWRLRDEVTGRTHEICYQRGVADYVEQLGDRCGAARIGAPFEHREVIHHHGVVSPDGEDVGRVTFDIALQLVDARGGFRSYVNLGHTQPVHAQPQLRRAHARRAASRAHRTRAAATPRARAAHLARQEPGRRRGVARPAQHAAT